MQKVTHNCDFLLVFDGFNSKQGTISSGDLDNKFSILCSSFSSNYIEHASTNVFIVMETTSIPLSPDVAINDIMLLSRIPLQIFIAFSTISQSS